MTQVALPTSQTACLCEEVKYGTIETYQRYLGHPW